MKSLRRYPCYPQRKSVRNSGLSARCDVAAGGSGGDEYAGTDPPRRTNLSTAVVADRSHLWIGIARLSAARLRRGHGLWHRLHFRGYFAATRLSAIGADCYLDRDVA